MSKRQEARASPRSVKRKLLSRGDYGYHAEDEVEDIVVTVSVSEIDHDYNDEEIARVSSREKESGVFSQCEVGSELRLYSDISTIVCRNNVDRHHFGISLVIFFFQDIGYNLCRLFKFLYFF